MPPNTPRLASMLARIAGPIVGIVGALIMLVLTPILFIYGMAVVLWYDAIIPMVRRWQSRPVTEEEARAILEQDRAKNPRYHTPDA
jgi:hypothetical protein